MSVFGCVQQCDDLEDEESLKHLYHILKGAIMLNSNRKPLSPPPPPNPTHPPHLALLMQTMRHG